MPSPPHTVLDGLEGVWERAARGWREANRLREEAEATKLRAQRQMIAGRQIRERAGGLNAPYGDDPRDQR